MALSRDFPDDLFIYFSNLLYSFTIFITANITIIYYYIHISVQSKKITYTTKS